MSTPQQTAPASTEELVKEATSFYNDAKAGKDPSIGGVKLTQAETYLTQASAALQMASTNASVQGAGLSDEAKSAASFLNTIESGLQSTFGKQADQK